MRRSNDFIEVIVLDEQKGRRSAGRDFDSRSTVAIRDQIAPCRCAMMPSSPRSCRAGDNANAFRGGFGCGGNRKIGRPDLKKRKGDR